MAFDQAIITPRVCASSGLPQPTFKQFKRLGKIIYIRDQGSRLGVMENAVGGVMRPEVLLI